ADEKGERIVVTIRADDTMQLNGMSMSREEVISRVKELNRVKMNLPVLISGDRRSSLGVGIELLSALKAAGVEKASFQVSGERGAGNGE
ncbi:MAG: biopolymer transporter ExbD, partial [Kiritimatiellae bacterium]|nr:biopolymer transporter ExbD [Kiritimatiellia bacterium]